MDHEYKGAYLSERAKEKCAPAAEDEEFFDKELRQILGEQYHDAVFMPAEYDQVAEEGAAEEKPDTCWNKVRALCGLAAGVGLLFYMVANGKIDTEYGLLFTAGVSAVCGYHLK